MALDFCKTLLITLEDLIETAVRSSRHIPDVKADENKSLIIPEVPGVKVLGVAFLCADEATDLKLLRKQHAPDFIPRCALRMD